MTRSRDEQMEARLRGDLSTLDDEEQSWMSLSIAKLLDGARTVLNPQQLCFICLVATAALYSYAVKTFASNTEVKQIHVTIIEQSLFDLRTKQCEAIRRLQPGAAYVPKMIELQRQYRELTGGAYQLPPCGEL